MRASYWRCTGGGDLDAALLPPAQGWQVGSDSSPYPCTELADKNYQESGGQRSYSNRKIGRLVVESLLASKVRCAALCCPVLCCSQNRTLGGCG